MNNLTQLRTLYQSASRAPPPPPPPRGGERHPGGEGVGVLLLLPAVLMFKVNQPFLIGLDLRPAPLGGIHSRYCQLAPMPLVGGISCRYISTYF